MRVLETVASGIAQINVEFSAWRAGRVALSHHEVPVEFPKEIVKLEPVSPRLVQAFIHPNRTSSLVGLRSSADGRRVVAASDSGTVVVWDVVTGKELTILETGSRLHENGNFAISPNCDLLVVAQSTIRTDRLERDGKQLTRYSLAVVPSSYGISGQAALERF